MEGYVIRIFPELEFGAKASQTDGFSSCYRCSVFASGSFASCPSPSFLPLGRVLVFLSRNSYSLSRIALIDSPQIHRAMYVQVTHVPVVCFLIRFIASGGLGVIGGDTINFVGIGGCTADHYLANLPGYCDGAVMRSPTMWLGIFTGGWVHRTLTTSHMLTRVISSFLTVFLLLYRVRGSILIGIFLTSAISWPRGTAVTAFPYTDEGNSAFDFFKQIVAFHPIKLVGNVIDYNYMNPRVWYALVTMLYVDILDTTGTLYSMAKFAGLRDPITMDFEGSTVAYCVDAVSISMGALMGTSPVTAFIESATGISGAPLPPHTT
jgi:xanthine/uracil/vitamin C permease (AzgA family)